MPIGENIATARRARGLTLRQLAAQLKAEGRVELSASALQRIESDQRRVASHELVELAEVLHTTTGALLGRRDRSSALALAARVSTQVPAEVFEQGGQRAVEILEAVDVLARTVGPLPEVTRPQLPTVPATRPGGRRLAALAREALGLGVAPIADLVELAETRLGAHVAHDVLPEGTHGFCVADEGDAVILVNADDRQGRQAFTLAHELAHLFAGDLDAFEVVRDGGATTGAEARADAFAAHFLVPAEGLRAEIVARVDAVEAQRLAYRFGVSTAAMLIRLTEEGLIDPAEAARARELGRQALSYRAQLFAEHEAAVRREGARRPPVRLADQALAAYVRGQVGLGLLAGVFGERNLARLRADLAERGFVPAAEVTDRASLA